MPNIDSSILNEIKLYCKINEIQDFDEFLNKIITIGFNIEKYGSKPDLGAKKIEKEEIIKKPEPASLTIKSESVKIKSNDDYGVYDL